MKQGKTKSGRSSPVTPKVETIAGSATTEKIKTVFGYAKNLREIVLVLFFYFGFARFSRPALEVTYQVDRLYPPIAAADHIKNAGERESADGNTPNVLSQLVNSRDILRVTIRNTSSDSIDELDLQVDGFTVADVALHSDSSRIMADRQKLAAFEISDNFTIRFPNLKSIPPKARMTMILWGDFHTFLWRGPVRLSAATKSVTVRAQGTTSGVRLFVADHLSLLGIFLAVGLLLLGLRRFR